MAAVALSNLQEGCQMREGGARSLQFPSQGVLMQLQCGGHCSQAEYPASVLLVSSVGGLAASGHSS
eukprot:9361646-Alexandrium_andersonii.AAC.1